MKTTIKSARMEPNAYRVLSDLSQEELTQLQEELSRVDSPVLTDRSACWRTLRALISIEELTIREVMSNAWDSARNQLEYDMYELVETCMDTAIAEEVGRTLADTIMEDEEYESILDEYKDKVEVRY